MCGGESQHASDSCWARRNQVADLVGVNKSHGHDGLVIASTVSLWCWHIILN